jgi:hypothetical protein
MATVQVKYTRGVISSIRNSQWTVSIDAYVSTSRSNKVLRARGGSKVTLLGEALPASHPPPVFDRRTLVWHDMVHPFAQRHLLSLVGRRRVARHVRQPCGARTRNLPWSGLP